MRNFLERWMGKEIDVHCGNAIVSGKITRIEGNVLCLEKDDATCYVNIDNILVVWDSRDKKVHPPGFVIKQ